MNNVDVRSSNDCVGIQCGTDRITACRATKTMLGGTKYQYAAVSLADRDLCDALSELIASLGVSKTTLPILAAIPTDECYFATRPIASGAANASPRVLLRESLRSSATRLDQMTIDVIYWQPDRRNVAGIAAAPTERVDAIRAAVAENGHSLQRLEPAASSLIGVAPEHEGRDRRGGMTTRVFLGDARLLAVMSKGGQPIHWQTLPLPAGDEATGIVSAVRALETAATACGLDRTPDIVVIHGREKLRTLIDQQWLHDNLPGDFRWIDSPMSSDKDVARAMADRFLSGEDEGLDFIRAHRDPLQLRRVVPYKEIVAYVVAASVLAGSLWLRVADVRNQHTRMISDAPPMVADGTNPKTERDQLNARATSISQFLDDRIQWSAVIDEVTHTLPQGVRLTDIRGSARMAQKRKKQTKTTPITMVLRGECALDEDGAMPSTLNGLADSMRSIDRIADHFDHVELADVRRTRSQDTGVAGAEFSLVFTTKD
tara:strand:- start:140609 stop:142069 length:1461 start_codon:yes stop_codon:yes gene_type:complete